MPTDLLHGSAGKKGADKMGTLHDMRSTTYDGDWDPYFNDFAAENPDILNLQFGETEGWRVRGLEINAVTASHQHQAHFCLHMVPSNLPEAAAS